LTLLLDAGALIALERNERPMWTRLKALQLAGELPVTNGGVLGQVWRGGPGQARLARAIEGVDIRAIDKPVGRTAGELLGGTGLSDVIDASLALLAMDGDEIATSDRDDFEILLAATGRHVELIHP